MPRQKSSATYTTIPQLKVVYCGSICESAPRYTSPLQVVEAITDDMQQLDREAFYVLHLDGKHRIISKELISLGSLNQSIVHPREVFKGALLNNSAAIIGVHNHPSGDPAPSREDKDITQRLLSCADIVGVKLLDHIIIGFVSSGPQYYSFVESGLLCKESTATAPTPACQPKSNRCAWLIEMRKQARITQKQLAELVGFKHQASISALENGWQSITEEIEKTLKSALKVYIDKRPAGQRP